MDSTEIFFSLVGGAGGLIGITKTIADIFIIRPRDKKRQKEAIENKARETEVSFLRDKIILKKIKGQLASFENRLLAEFERESEKVIFPVKVQKENFKETLTQPLLKDEYKSALIKANKICRDELETEFSFYKKGIVKYSIDRGISILTSTIHDMYREVIIKNAGDCELTRLVTNKLTREDVEKSIKLLFYYVTSDVDELHQYEDSISKNERNNSNTNNNKRGHCEDR